LKLTTHFLSAAEVKDTWSFASVSYPFMAWCFIQHMDKFDFTLKFQEAMRKIKVLQSDTGIQNYGILSSTIGF
jgi:hypothetical protein